MEIDPLSFQQLEAFRELTLDFNRAGVGYWLFGGWAVDFYVGRITRPHDDIDVAVWLADMPKIREFLRVAGWKHAPDPDEDGGTGFERGAVRLEATFLEAGPDGVVYTALRQGRIAWAGDGLGSEVRELSGITANLLGLRALARAKANARDEPADATKDRCDQQALVAMMEKQSDR